MNYGAQLSIDVPASTAFLQLDTKSKLAGQGVNKCDVTKDGKYFEMNKPIRYALHYTNFFWNIKNVTARNNKIKVFNGATEYNVTMPIGFYNLATFISAFQLALNTAFSGFLVSDTGPLDGHRIAVLNATPYTIASSGQVRSPWEMAGFNFDGNQTYTVHRGYAKLWYTRYVDCISLALNKFQNIPDESSNYPTSNVLVRIFGDDGSSTNAIREDITSPLTQPHRVQFSADFPKWVHWGREGSNLGLGGLIDLSLIDEYGQVVEMDDPQEAPDYSMIFLVRSLE